MCATLVGGFLGRHCECSKGLLPVAVPFQKPQLIEPDYELQNPGWSPLRTAHNFQVMPHSNTDNKSSVFLLCMKCQWTLNIFYQHYREPAKFIFGNLLPIKVFEHHWLL